MFSMAFLIELHQSMHCGDLSVFVWRLSYLEGVSTASTVEDSIDAFPVRWSIDTRVVHLHWARPWTTRLSLSTRLTDDLERTKIHRHAEPTDPRHRSTRCNSHLCEVSHIDLFVPSDHRALFLRAGRWRSTVWRMQLTSAQSTTLEFTDRKCGMSKWQWVFFVFIHLTDECLSCVLRSRRTMLCTSGNEWMSSFVYSVLHPRFSILRQTFASSPFDVNWSLHFDDCLFSPTRSTIYSNFMTFPRFCSISFRSLSHYLTPAKSWHDKSRIGLTAAIQFFIACSLCQLRSFTAND